MINREIYISYLLAYYFCIEYKFVWKWRRIRRWAKTEKGKGDENHQNFIFFVFKAVYFEFYFNFIFKTFFFNCLIKFNLIFEELFA